jgi:hypothetical protein
VLVCHLIDLPDDDDLIEAETNRRDVTNNYAILTVQFVESNIGKRTANFRNFPRFSLLPLKFYDWLLHLVGVLYEYQIKYYQLKLLKYSKYQLINIFHNFTKYFTLSIITNKHLYQFSLYSLEGNISRVVWSVFTPKYSYIIDFAQSFRPGHCTSRNVRF